MMCSMTSLLIVVVVAVLFSYHMTRELATAVKGNQKHSLLVGVNLRETLF